MYKSVLILTEKKTVDKESLSGQKIDWMKIHRQEYFIPIESINSYKLCIIELQASVSELLYYSNEIRKFYSLPICVFEADIIERYPGEKEKLKGNIDIMIQRSLSKLDFFQLISNILS